MPGVTIHQSQYVLAILRTSAMPGNITTDYFADHCCTADRFHSLTIGAAAAAAARVCSDLSSSSPISAAMLRK